MSAKSNQGFENRLENDVFQHRLDFDAEPSRHIEPDETLVVDLDGFEGPLHVLLELARAQKVDLLKISITKLAEQYLIFIHEARRLRFALAADYLVMASWLAYLKSKLLLPKSERKASDGPAPEELAQALAFRLQKLEAMRKSVEALTSRPQLMRDVFTRGDPEALTIIPSSNLDVSIFDLMSAYVTQRRKEIDRFYDPTRRIEAYPLDEARNHLRQFLPELSQWTPLSKVTPNADFEGGPNRASYMASTLSASLELAKEGELELQQLDIFETLYLRSRQPSNSEALGQNNGAVAHGLRSTLPSNSEALGQNNEAVAHG